MPALTTPPDSGTLQYLGFDHYYFANNHGQAFDDEVARTYWNLVSRGKGAYPLPEDVVDPLATKLSEPVKGRPFNDFMKDEHAWVPDSFYTDYTPSVARFLIDQNWDRLVNPLPAP